MPNRCISNYKTPVICHFGLNGAMIYDLIGRIGPNKCLGVCIYSCRMPVIHSRPCTDLPHADQWAAPNGNLSQMPNKTQQQQPLYETALSEDKLYRTRYSPEGTADLGPTFELAISWRKGYEPSVKHNIFFS